MAKVTYADEAFADFERIAGFLLETAPETTAGAQERISSAIVILDAHPLIGLRVDDDSHELVISRGVAGYLALYRFDPAFDVVRILRLRHQREAGFRE